MLNWYWWHKVLKNQASAFATDFFIANAMPNEGTLLEKPICNRLLFNIKLTQKCKKV